MSDYYAWVIEEWIGFQTRYCALWAILVVIHAVLVVLLF